jgi:hypothetical protein
MFEVSGRERHFCPLIQALMNNAVAGGVIGFYMQERSAFIIDEQEGQNGTYSSKNYIMKTVYKPSG